MKNRAALALALVGSFGLPSRGDDWPQWMGAKRDARVTGFEAPKEWPKELTQKWKVSVGEGVATPALVGDRLFVFSWEAGKEVTRALNAETGKEIWQDKYDCARASGSASGFAGARSTPAVVDGKVITLGARGTLSCLDAADSRKIWRLESTGGYPRFFSSSSPIILNDMVIAQFGSEGKGGIAAYALADGKDKWKWSDEGSAYASPTLLTVDGTIMIVAETDKSIVGIGAADGKQKWKIPFPVTGGRGYNASTPIVDGTTVYFSGSNRGTRAVKIEKSSDGGFTTKELWENKANSVIFNTPIVKAGWVFGLTSGNNLYCLNAETGKEGWTASIRGRGGYGSIVDAGSVLIALTPAGQLIVYEPNEKELKELATYKVGSDTYAYPVISGKRIYVKDKDSVTMWAIE